MIITCEQCQARFRMADEKLKPGGTKVRCSKCRHVFTVMPPEPAEEKVTVSGAVPEVRSAVATAVGARLPPPTWS